MPWILLLTLLCLPILLVQSRHVAARLGLLVFGLGLEGYVAFLLCEGGRIEEDLRTDCRYALDTTSGLHRIPIEALSQRSMKGVLRGGDGMPSRSDLEAFRWKFQDPVLATWFEPRQHQEADPGDTLLFYAQWSGAATLEYTVGESNARLLAGRTLVVTHDASAEHMLRDHALASIRIEAWALGLWGGLWMAVQGFREWRRRHRPPAGA
jgi:hypothetical protein